MDATTFNTPPPSALENELREKTARLNDLERQVNRLQELVGAGRRDSDFDLFYRRLQVAEKFSQLPPDAMETLHLMDVYPKFWQLAGEAHLVTKFSEDEKIFSQQILEQVRREQNPIRRQYLVLIGIIFGELTETMNFMETKFWSQQLRKDFALFINWNQLVNSSINPRLKILLTKIVTNELRSASLYDKYSALIQKHSQAVINDELCPRVPQEDYQIYFCWLQGEDNLPLLNRCCYNSLKQNAGHYKIVFIDEKNFSDYVDIAPHIIDKFRAGKITPTHFSDILRVNLLERHGGLWLDASILVTAPLENHESLFEKPFFTIKYHKEKKSSNTFATNISSGRWMVGIQGTNILHNPIYVFIKEFFDEYLRDNDKFANYFLLDFAINLAYENIPAAKKIIDDTPINNLKTCYARGRLNDLYDDFHFDELEDTFLLSLNRRVPLDMTRDDTVFREIQRRYAPETIQK